MRGMGEVRRCQYCTMRQQWRVSQGCGGRYARIGVCQRVSAIFFENVGFERKKRSGLSQMCSLRLASVERLPPDPALLAFSNTLGWGWGFFRLRLCQCTLLPSAGRTLELYIIVGVQSPVSVHRCILSFFFRKPRIAPQGRAERGTRCSRGWESRAVLGGRASRSRAQVAAANRDKPLRRRVFVSCSVSATTSQNQLKKVGYDRHL